MALAAWKHLKLGRDCYVEVDRSYFSAPHWLIGQKLWVCGRIQQVRIFDQNYHLIATQQRADHSGTRRTHHNHLFPEKAARVAAHPRGLPGHRGGNRPCNQSCCADAAG
jgi:hypothetical protein